MTKWSQNISVQDIGLNCAKMQLGHESFAFNCSWTVNCSWSC